jgi:hypothetical protein
MKLDTRNMSPDEIKRAIILIENALEIGMDLTGSGDIEKTSSRRLFLSLDDYAFEPHIGLSMPIDKSSVQVSRVQDGNEQVKTLLSFGTVEKVEFWIDRKDLEGS